MHNEFNTLRACKEENKSLGSYPTERHWCVDLKADMFFINEFLVNLGQWLWLSW